MDNSGVPLSMPVESSQNAGVMFLPNPAPRWALMVTVKHCQSAVFTFDSANRNLRAVFDPGQKIAATNARPLQNAGQALSEKVQR